MQGLLIFFTRSQDVIIVPLTRTWFCLKPLKQNSEVKNVSVFLQILLANLVPLLSV